MNILFESQPPFAPFFFPVDHLYFGCRPVLWFCGPRPVPSCPSGRGDREIGGIPPPCRRMGPGPYHPRTRSTQLLRSVIEDVCPSPPLGMEGRDGTGPQAMPASKAAKSVCDVGETALGSIPVGAPMIRPLRPATAPPPPPFGSPQGCSHEFRGTVAMDRAAVQGDASQLAHALLLHGGATARLQPTPRGPAPPGGGGGGVASLDGMFTGSVSA